MSESDLQFLIWIKRKSETPSARDVVNLATSGVTTSFAERWLLDSITNRSAEIVERFQEPNQFGLPSLKNAIRAAYDLPTNREIVCTSGASGAIRLVCEFLLAGRSGGEIVVESPVYEPLRAIPERLGAKIVLADRSSGLQSIMQSVSNKTVAIFLTNPHNPTGIWLSSSEILDLSHHVERISSQSLIVVDETFGDVGPQPGATAAITDRRIVTMASLSKSFGLPSLRCGWVTFDPGVLPGFVEDAVLFQNIGCKIAEILGAMALEEVDAFRQATGRHVDGNRALVASWLKDMTDAAVIQPQTVLSSCVTFPRLLNFGSPAEVVDQLEDGFGVLVTPGRFFGAAYDNHIRIGFGGDHDELKRGLSRLSDGLVAIRRTGL
jgi:aspartate/methionine/tyrosine aminotransferase